MRTEPTTPQIGVEAEITALGKTWKVGRLDVAVWDQLLEWAKPRIINPLEYLRPLVKDLPSDVLSEMIREARDKCPFVLTILHPLFQQCVHETPEGQVESFYLLLKKHHPDVTRDDALSILQEIGQEKQQDIIEKAAGRSKPAKKSDDRAEWDETPVITPAGKQLAVDSEFSTEGVSLIAAKH